MITPKPTKRKIFLDAFRWSSISTMSRWSLGRSGPWNTLERHRRFLGYTKNITWRPSKFRKSVDPICQVYIIRLTNTLIQNVPSLPYNRRWLSPPQHTVNPAPADHGLSPWHCAMTIIIRISLSSLLAITITSVSLYMYASWAPPFTRHIYWWPL